MARTTITPTQVTRDGVADPTATPGTADGHKFQNNGWTYLRATNSNLLVSQAVMFPIPVTVDGEPVEDKMVEVPANTTLTIGAGTMQAVFQFWGTWRPEAKDNPIAKPRVRQALGVELPLREFFAALKPSQLLGYQPGHFSFNSPLGRCPECKGRGFLEIEMQFLPDVYVPCEVCKGARYNREALEIHYKGRSIAEVLEMTVEEAVEVFSAVPSVASPPSVRASRS